MSLAQRVAKNTLSLILASVISMVLGLLYGIYVARYLGPERYGTISFAIAFIGLFSILTDMGLQQLALREVARDKGLVGSYLANIVVIKLFLSVITCGLIALVINLLKYPEPTVEIVYVMALSTVITAFSSMFSSMFQAFQRMEYSSLASVINSASMLAGGLFAVYHGFSVMGFAQVYVLSSALGLIYVSVVALRLGIVPDLRSGLDFGFMKSLIRRALPFGIGGFFLVYYVWIARVMLSVMVDNEVVGYYSAAYTLMNSLSFIPSAFVASLFPIMAIFFKGSDRSLDRVYRIGVKYMYMLALPIAVGVTLLSRDIINQIYGPGFQPSSQALAILIWAEFFVFIDILLGQMLFSINRERITMINAGIGAAINIGLNLVLIPRMGMVGAALATLSTEAFFFIFAYTILQRTGHTIDLQTIFFKPLIATSVMALFITLFSNLHLFVLIFLSAILYFTILYLIKYISDDDITLIKQALAIKGWRLAA